MISLFPLHPSLFFPMLAPYKGRVYDPCCGSAGIFVQSEKFVEEHGGRRCLTTTSCCYSGPSQSRLVGAAGTTTTPPPLNCHD